jgi:hypothetical protein
MVAWVCRVLRAEMGAMEQMVVMVVTEHLAQQVLEESLVRLDRPVMAEEEDVIRPTEILAKMVAMEKTAVPEKMEKMDIPDLPAPRDLRFQVLPLL